MPSKLGPHGIRPTGSARRMVEAGCKIVKLVSDLGAAGEYLAINPDLLIIGRFLSHFPDDPSREITAENLQHINPVDAARFFVNVQSEKYNLNPKIKYWEGLNEPVWDNLDQQRWYGLFEAERVRLLAAKGLKAVIGNFSYGIPHILENDLSWWEAFLPALQAAKQFDGILGLHEYNDDKFFTDWDGKYGWKVFRYRRVHDWFLVPKGLGDLKIVLTEFGILDFRVRSLNYNQELMWADSEFRKDPYLLGATIFLFGSDNPAWDNFDVDGSYAADPLVEYVRSIKDSPDPVVTPPPVTPPPVVDKVEGVDVSKWQGIVDWQKVKDFGIKFAIARISDGLELDPQFERNWSEIKSKGLFRGVYQFFRASRSGVEQADFLLSQISKFENGDFPPILDVETLDGQSPNKLGVEITNWINTIKSKLNVTPIIYTAPGIWNQYNLTFPNTDLWVAHWTNAQNPILPRGWNTWKIWQYKVDVKNSVPGINTTIDRNRFNGDFNSLESYLDSVFPEIVIPPSNKFKPNDKVKITTTALNIRSTPKFIPSTTIPNNIEGQQTLNSVGIIIGGPVRSDNINWWQVNFETGVDGWASEVFLEKVVIVPPPPPPPAPIDRLIFEERFNNGHYLPFGPLQDNKRYPNGWKAWIADPSTPRIEGQDSTQWWIEEESEIKTIDNVHVSEKTILFDDTVTTHLLHQFKGWGRLWSKVWRTFNLEPGKYRIEIKFWPDILLDQNIIDNKIVKVPDLNPLNNEFRFIKGRDELPFILGDQHPSGQYNIKTLIFDHVGGEIDLGFEYRVRWGVKVVGHFTQYFRIVKLI